MPVALPVAVFVSLPALVSVLCAALPTSPAASFTPLPAFLSVWCTLAPTFFSVCACAAGAVTMLPARPAAPANAAIVRNLEIRIPHPLVRSVHGRAAADRLRVAGSSEPPLPPLPWKCKRRARTLRSSRSHFSASFLVRATDLARSWSMWRSPGGTCGVGSGAGREARQSDQKSTKELQAAIRTKPGIIVRFEVHHGLPVELPSPPGDRSPHDNRCRLRAACRQSPTRFRAGRTPRRPLRRRQRHADPRHCDAGRSRDRRRRRLQRHRLARPVQPAGADRHLSDRGDPPGLQVDPLRADL